MVGGLKSYEVLGEEIAEDGMSAKVKLKVVNGQDEEKESEAEVEKTDKGWVLRF